MSNAKTLHLQFADGEIEVGTLIDALYEQERTIAILRQHKNDYMEAAEGTRKALEAENARLERLVSHWQGLAVTNRKVADDALAQLAAAPQAEPDSDWIACSERKPPSGQTVLAFYLNAYGMWRRIRAQHVDAWTIQVDDLSDPDTECVEYSEQEDAYYLLAGWYECIDNWDDYSRIAVNEGIIAHWMPLPAAPTLSAEQPGGDSWKK